MRVVRWRAVQGSLKGQRMSMNYEVLTVELTAGHPVSGAYNSDAQLAAGDSEPHSLDLG